MEAAITALLAPVAGGRRHWSRAPQGTALPYVVLHRISGNHDYTMAGASGYVASRIQVDIYGETYGQTKPIAAQIQSILSGYKGGDIFGVFLDNVSDRPDTDGNGPSTTAYLFRTIMDFRVHHKG